MHESIYNKVKAYAYVGNAAALLELPFVGLGQQEQAIWAPPIGLDRPHSYGPSPGRARTSFWTCQRCQKAQRTALASEDVPWWSSER